MTWGEDRRTVDDVIDMALVGRRDGRSFGCGRQLSYAGPQALKDMFGGGHYGTVKAHSDRWLAFVRWCRSEQGPGINDARQIDRKVLADYADYLREVFRRGDLGVSTAQNRLISVNRTMAALRGDHYVENCPARARRWVCSVPEVANGLRKANTANRLSRSSMRFAVIITHALPRSFYLREPPACVCARLSWLTYQG